MLQGWNPLRAMIVDSFFFPLLNGRGYRPFERWWSIEGGSKQTWNKYVRLIRDAPKHIVHFAVNLGHFTLDSSFRLAKTRFEKRHLFACYLIQMLTWCLSHENINVVIVRDSRDSHSAPGGIELLSKSNHLQLKTYSSFCVYLVPTFYSSLSYLGWKRVDDLRNDSKADCSC